MKLLPNSRIFVVGGGPAGAFFSYYVLKIAKEKGLNLDLTIFEGKLFSRSGPPGCNYCAGVISETLIEKMERIGISLPPEIARSTVEGYSMVTRKGKLFLAHPLRKKRIVTVFRGNGPLFSNITKNISFDDFLLREAVKAGAKVNYRRVKSIHISRNPEDMVTVELDNGEKLKADLVVGAFGLNTELMKKVESMNFGYRPPKVIRTCQTEIKLDPEFVKEKFGNYIFIFNMGVKKLRFSAIIPKGEYITITLVGKDDLAFSDMENFLKAPFMREMLPEGWSLPYQNCHCLPRIPLNSAKKPYANRFIIIGDASCSRYYKNGIESALITAILAAETIINSGISEKEIKKGYWKRARKIAFDNYFGRLLFRLNDFIARVGFIVESHLRIVRSGHFTSSILKDILWNLFTGNKEYKKIFIKTLHPFLLLTMIVSGTITIFNNLKRFFLKRYPKGDIRK